VIKTYSKDSAEEFSEIEERENLAGKSTDDRLWQPEQQLDTGENVAQDFLDFVEDGFKVLDIDIDIDMEIIDIDIDIDINANNFTYVG
jgi:hypothetical protein